MLPLVKRAGSLALVLACCWWAGPAHGAATVTIGSAGLHAVVSQDPWRISFVQPSGGAVDEVATTDASPYGTLSFGFGATPPYGGAPSAPAADGWFHATRSVSAKAVPNGQEFTVATNDPLGAQLDVTVVEERPGVIAVHSKVTGRSGAMQMAESFGAQKGEHFSGFGGRENLLDQSGQTVEDYAEEGAWIASDRPFIPPFIEPWTYSTRDDGAYFPMPWLVSSRGYGFLLDNSERSLFRLGSDRADAWNVEVDAPRLDYRVFAGPTPLGVVRRFSADIGRQPAPAAPWVLGPWWQPTGADEAKLPGEFRREDIPGSLIMTYSHYLPGGGQNDKAEQQSVAGFHAAGYADTTYFNPMISVQNEPLYDQAKAAGVLLKDASGQPAIVRYNQYVVSEFDFTSAAGRAFYEHLLSEAVANGYDGWMEDFGEYTPPDAVGADGTPGSALHNLYPKLYHCAAYALTGKEPRPVVQFDRSGWTGSGACSPIVWSGDPTTDWSFDGLSGMVTQGLNYGYSGIGIYGSDVGGFFSVTAPPTTPELLARWLEFGAFSGVMRTESEGFTAPNQTAPRAQIWDKGVKPIWRRYAKLRTQLYPYIAALAHRYETSGVPMMESLGLAYPRDPQSWTGPSRFLFGPELLVAPVVAPGVTSATVPLPPGRWRPFWSAVGYASGDGSFHIRHRPALSGQATVKAPLAVIPLFVRAGALLPLVPPDVATLAAYGTGTIHLGDRAGRIHLLAWPAGRTSATALGTRLVSRLTTRRWTLRVSGKRPKTIDLEADLPRAARSLRWNGQALRGHSHGPVLRLALRGTGTLSAQLAR